MLRCALFAVAVCATLPNTQAAGPELNGNWLLSYALATGDQGVCILKVETTGGRPTASVASAPKGAEFAVSNFAATDKEVTFNLKQTNTIQGREIVTDLKFVGTPGKDGKVVYGSIGPDTAAPRRAKLTATDKTELTPADRLVKSAAGDAYAKVNDLLLKPTQIQIKLQQEKDDAARQGLMKERAAAVAEQNQKLPGLLREVIAKHPDSVAAAESAMLLLRNAQTKLNPDEAAKMAEVVRKQSEPYGPRFATANLTALAEAVAPRKDVGPLLLKLVEPLATGLTDKTKAADQAKVLTLYKTALTNAGRAAEAKEVDSRLAKLEPKLDEEYLAAVPPFKPTAYAGRKESGANQVAVMELFTGAQCPPCVAADVAFDALLKAYKPSELILIQYHVHIPGPDPLTNADTQARAQYYGVSSAPTSIFNGKPAARGGGGMAQGEGKFNEYAGVINPLLEKKTDVKLTGKATRTGDKIAIAVEVGGAAGGDLKLRLLVVEESVRYVGGNQIRFHHHVVRAMPGGADGVAVKDKTFKHTATADVADIRAAVTKYLDGFVAKSGPFRGTMPAVDLKHLKVIALVQNDKTREIVQAAQFDLGEKSAGGTGGQ
jgi:hypothetical protein